MSRHSIAQLSSLQMRLFIGIDLPPEVIANLEDLLQRLKPSAQINWSPPRNLHITTKFVGEWPEERLAELKSSLGGLPSRQPIANAIQKVGFLPNPHSPRAVWAGGHAGDHLTAPPGHTDPVLRHLA